MGLPIARIDRHEPVSDSPQGPEALRYALIEQSVKGSFADVPTQALP